ncbi:MAG: hypothetical protein NVSMB13_17580 [Mycobacteriales bacterium]
MRPASLLRFALAVLPVLATGVLISSPAYAGPGESDFVSLVNSARASAGLAPYSVAGDLSAVARNWAAHMAATRTLSHNPSLASQVSGWSAVGENIGYGGSVSIVNTLLMNSPTHRGNILSSTYSQIGVGTATASDGSLWVSEVFRLPLGGAAPAAAPPPADVGGSSAVAPRASRDRPADPPGVAPAPVGDPQGPPPPPPPLLLPAPPPPPVDPAVLLAERLRAATAGHPDPGARDPLLRALDHASMMSVLTDGTPAA